MEKSDRHPPVFVHGNPETADVWGPLAGALDRPIVRLSPPGFGAPLHADLPATMDAYRDWLIGELDALGEPVDLVGHDWGGLHTLNAVMARPDLVRTWASDTVGALHPDHVWHQLAQECQTPGTGEDAVEQRFGADLATRTASLVGRGFPADVAARVAAGQGPEMGRAVLSLYRSALQPALADAGRALPRAATRPGLALAATADSVVGTVDQRQEAAALAGARVQLLPDRGHRWMREDPAQGAAALQESWESAAPG